eukprot:14358585-Ditylum_brightwellii.AAC.1
MRKPNRPIMAQYSFHLPLNFIMAISASAFLMLRRSPLDMAGKYIGEHPSKTGGSPMMCTRL